MYTQGLGDFSSHLTQPRSSTQNNRGRRGSSRQLRGTGAAHASRSNLTN